MTNLVSRRSLAATIVALALVTACTASDEDAGETADSQDVAQQQEQLAAGLGIENPPTVDVIRIVTPEERGALVDACLAEEGFPVGDGSQGFPESQLEAFNLAQFVCMARYPVDPEVTGTWTEVQTAIQYEWTVNVLIPCLEGLGYVIANVPSREVFIENWFTSPFRPYAQLPVQSFSNEESAALNEQCPQGPPSAVLYGGEPIEGQ